ncbi:MAG: hypothetical protein AB7G13_21700 [Lautropia sp.]
MKTSRKFGPLRSVALTLALAAGLAGCGGTGAGAGGGAPVLGAAAAEEAVTAQDIKISLYASSTTLPADGSAPIDLTAVVTDAATGVAVQDKTVEFVLNPAAGLRLEVTQAKTDASGVATARVFLNGDPTPRDFRVLASVDQKTPGELALKVGTAVSGGIANNSRGELTVRLGTDNLLENLTDLLSYRKRYVAIITDNAGIPKQNSSVLATLRAKRYYVGYWAPGWSQVRLNPAGQQSEDTSDFGNCNTGEDYNGDGVLTPGNTAAYTVTSQTDANGLAVINITYPKSFAMWVDMELEVTATVGGTEGKNSLLIPLPILAEDVTGTPPPPSISRSRGSLSAPQGAGLTFPLTVAEINAGITLDTVVPGSPFPWQSVSPTCN